MHDLFSSWLRPLTLVAAMAFGTTAIAQEATTAAAPTIVKAHAIAMYDQPKYPADFKHFDYVNPVAPKGGTLRLSATGAFDSFNPFIVGGRPAAISAIYETLTVGSADEPFTQYGLIAESLEYPQDRSWVIFTLRPEARWHDGAPITAEDVVWSFDFLTAQGHPRYGFYYQNVAAVEALDERHVKFTFKPGDNRELPLIVGQMPILPKHYWTAAGRDPAKTTLEPPLGSGPYRIGKFEPGRFVELERVPDYWGRDLPVRVGQNNFDKQRYSYYRDTLVQRQALFSDEIDLYVESQAKAWALDYDVPPVRDGRILLRKFDDMASGGMQNFAFNTRRPVFQDRRVRWALAQALDFEWMNRNLFFDQYVRPNSYFFPTELGARGLPNEAELKILEPYRGRIPDEVFTQAYEPPTTDGSGWPRANLEKAFQLLAEAGWVVRDMKLVKADTGEQMSFEILLGSPMFERVALPLKHNLERLGIDVRVRTVDPSQYQERVDNFDFDMVVGGVGQSLSPGNEQRGYWTAAAAQTPGSQNLAGIADPVVDQLVEFLIAAPDRQSLIDRTRALDRVLLWGHYAIPQWSAPFLRIAYWDRFGYPPEIPLQGVSLDTWWFDPAKLAPPSPAAHTQAP